MRACEMTYSAGIDIGGNYTKTLILCEDGRIVGKSLIRTGFNYPKAAERGIEAALADGGLEREELSYIAATGFGRYMVPQRDIHITELTCHAKGAHHQFPATRTILDVGGQTLKAIRADQRGKVKSFRLNDKCAAGTGAFLEKTARYMGYDTGDIGPLALRSTRPVTVSSVCAVFAESEVINHLTNGTDPADIMNGAVISLAGRAAQLMKRVGLEEEYTITGGMSRVPAFVLALQQALGRPVNVPDGDMTQFNGALGAALLGAERLRKLRSRLDAPAQFLH